MCQHINDVQHENMFFVSLIVCILLNVITVQPIYGAVENSVTKKGQAEQISPNNNGSQMYSDSFTQKNSTIAQNVSNSVGSSSTDKSKVVGHNRGITNTSVDLAPSPVSNSSSSGNIKSSTQSSDVVKKTNITDTNANSTTKSIGKVTIFPLNKNVVQQLVYNNHTILLPYNSSTTTTTTTTAKPTTTTTSAPKKPLITLSVEDIPGLLSKASESQPPLSNQESPIDEAVNDGPLSLQSSETITYPKDKSNPNFVMAIIGIIFVIPLIIIVTNCTVRKVRDVWSKRKYRRMNYLIEDMYN